MTTIAHATIWEALDSAKIILGKTNDQLLRSSIPILAATLARPDPVELHRAEQTALDYVVTMETAYQTVFGFDEST